ADFDGYTVRKITRAGEVSTLAGATGLRGSTDAAGAAARFSGPRGVAIDSAGNVYVADANNSTIRKITSAGEVSTFAGAADSFPGNTDATGAAARFFAPEGIAIDSADNLYVADTNNNTIRKITPVRVVTTFAGSTDGRAGTADGTGAAARFFHSEGVAIDRAGNLYVADRLNYTIRKITPAGVVTTLAGRAGRPGSADGTRGARFNHPEGVATDIAGNVYVADTYNHTIRKITPAAEVTTLAGPADRYGSIDATGAAARFTAPLGVATDGAGNVYVADGGNSTVRKITPAGAVRTLAGTGRFAVKTNVAAASF